MSKRAARTASFCVSARKRMEQEYKKEPLITLSEARKLSEYTSDHLAYLCRKGFLVSERHGRIWLTCEKAVEDYQSSLQVAGKPVTVAEQSDILQKQSVEASVQPRVKAIFRTLAQHLSRSFVEPFKILLRPPIPVTIDPLKYQSAGLAELGFSVGLPPEGLLTCDIPTYIAQRSIAGHVAAACFSIALLLLVLQGGNTMLVQATSAGIQYAEKAVSVLANVSSEALQMRMRYPETRRANIIASKNFVTVEDEGQKAGRVAGESIKDDESMGVESRLPIAEDVQKSPAISAWPLGHYDMQTSPDVLYKMTPFGTEKYEYGSPQEARDTDVGRVED